MRKLIPFLFVFAIVFCRFTEAKGIYWLAYGDGTLQALNADSHKTRVLGKIENVKGEVHYDSATQKLYFIWKQPRNSRSITVVNAVSRTAEVKFPGFDEVIIPRSEKVSFITMVSSENYLEDDPMRSYERMEIRDRNQPRKLFAKTKTGDAKYLFGRSHCSNGSGAAVIDGLYRRATGLTGLEVPYDYGDDDNSNLLVDCWDDGILLVPEFDANWEPKKGVFRLVFPRSSRKATLKVDTKLRDETVNCVAAGEQTNRWMCVSEGNAQKMTVAVYDGAEEVDRKVLRKAVEFRDQRFIPVGASQNRDVLFWLNQRVSRGDTLHRGNVLLIVDLRAEKIRTSFVTLVPPKDSFGLPAELQVVFDAPSAGPNRSSDRQKQLDLGASISSEIEIGRLQKDAGIGNPCADEPSKSAQTALDDQLQDRFSYRKDDALGLLNGSPDAQIKFAKQVGSEGIQIVAVFDE